MLVINAATRLTAAKANVKATLEFLTELGFKGLSLKSNSDTLIKFFYKSYDEDTLVSHLGKPKTTEPSIRFNFGKDKVVAIWPLNKTVLLKDTGVAVLQAPVVKPEKKVEPTIKDIMVQSPNTPGSTENDDSKVPEIHVSPAIDKQYAAIRGLNSPHAQLSFMKTLWPYLNENKFAGKMKVPNLVLLKKMGATSMRLRGRWWAHNRTLEVSPRLFNASQNFFVEVFLNEMCHQAVSEIDRVRENENKGHGPLWTKWMKHVGLNPRRYDPNDNTVYMTEKEKKEFEKRKEENKQKLEIRKDMAKELGLHNVYPMEGMNATIFTNGKPVYGMLVCKGRKQQGREVWAFLPESTVTAIKDISGIPYLNVYSTQVYSYGGTDPQHATPAWDILLAALGKSICGKPIKRLRAAGT